MEVENETFNQDDTDLEENLNQTAFLLQRIRELQTWQQEQERQLLREQELQIGRLVDANSRENFSASEAEDDDTTIGQDLSSLTSMEEYPRDIQFRQSATLTPTSDVVEALDQSSLPSWASREDISPKEKKNENKSADRPKKLNSSLLEDRPIVGSQKRFDELLAEQLGKDQIPQTKEDRSNEAAEESSSPVKKTFLRKGSGLVRFGGVGAPPRRMIRSRSQVLHRSRSAESMKALSGSCPRMNVADKETIAFASKKLPTKSNKPVVANTKASPAVAPTARPPSILKLNSSSNSSPGILRKKETSTPTQIVSSAIPVKQATKHFRKETSQISSGNYSTSNGLYDSVELSFIEKLAKAENSHKKDLEDLKAFELLEEAACDSSFCSSSSTVKRLIQNTHHLPSPIPKPSLSIESLTSTPIAKSAKKSQIPDSSSASNFDGSLKSDIEAFLTRNRVSNAFHNADDERGLNGHYTSKGIKGRNDDDDDGSVILQSLPETGDKVSILNGSVSDDEENDHLEIESDILGAPSRSKNRVRFNDGQNADDNGDVDDFEDDRNGQMSFSPPRIPKNSASYLIWSVFAKDREKEEKKKLANGKSVGEDFSPLSNAKLSKPKTELDFHTTILNAKLAELEKEIAHFKSENEKLSVAKRKLQTDRKTLAENVRSFETMKEVEKKKLDEERKWVRREKILLDKTMKEKKNNFERRTQEEVDELQNKLSHLNDELQRKETKWAAAVTKLQEQVKFLERENQHMHQENHKLKLKGVSSKISTHLVDPLSTARKLAAAALAGSEPTNGTPDSGFRSQDNLNDVETRKKKGSDSTTTNLKTTIYNTLCDTSDEAENNSAPLTSSSATSTLRSQTSTANLTTPRMTFSPAESLDSNMTLVSTSTNPVTLTTVSSGDFGLIDENQTRSKNNNDDAQKQLISRNAVVKSVVRNKEKKLTEKIYSDGSVEICFDKGNRKEVSPDGSITKIFYHNGDSKETIKSGLVKYFYSQTKTWHLTYPDGKEVFQFSNGQEEIRYPNGNVQISFSDGSVKKIFSDGTEETKFPDGTQVSVAPSGDRTLLMPNGQKEFHTSNMKRREYPDGTIRILYNDGRYETRSYKMTLIELRTDMKASFLL